MRQFEPADISMSIEAQVDPGDTVADVIKKAKKLVVDTVEAEYERLKKVRFESIDDPTEKSV